MTHTRLAVATGVGVITLISGFVHGKLYNRWGVPADMITAGEQLSNVPDLIGQWEKISDDAISAEAQRQLRCTGNFVREYRHRDNGKMVRVALIVGPPGPTAQHTPEICMPASGFQLQSDRRVLRIPDGSGFSEFWELRFRPAQAYSNTALRVVYAWSDGGKWIAAESPRMAFGGIGKLLYKIQLSGAYSEILDEQDADPCESFLRDYLASGNQFGQ